ncbi:sulfatase [Terriglobus sp. TAA 43]|uniref:sulfatase family protein n=1 Tax=Terriglobus sp. TAA 43 TaxID=278961 RepID=UPI001E2D3F5A|nr:sulfatase [Terriglobus sp. TAA 43]
MTVLDRREFLVKSSQAMMASSLVGVRGEAQGKQPAKKSNILWLVADQMRAQALGINGDPNAHTPNIDRLSRSGINFQQARSGFPLCCPFRGTMLTSRYPHHMVPGHEYPLPSGQKTVANLFNDAGYHTGYFGKWHLGGFHESEGRATMYVVPPERRGGFKTWIGYENNNSPWDTWVHGGEGKDAFQYRLPGYESDSLTDLLIKYIRERAAEQKAGKGQPFFGVLSVEPSHNPYIAPPQFMSRYNAEQIKLRPNVPADETMPGKGPRVLGGRETIGEKSRQDLAGYYAQIENWDWNIGRIIETLTSLNLLDDTHIMIFADHGDTHGSHGQFLKTNPYEESVRIPMIVSGSEAFYDGHETGKPNVLFSAIDIAPTALGLCNVAIPDWMEGNDLSGHRLQSRPRPKNPDSMYLQNVIPTGHADSVNTPYRGIVTTDGWKYVCLPRQSWMMFNLIDDPYEQVNVAFNDGYKADRKRLLARLKQWVTDTSDTFELPES